MASEFSASATPRKRKRGDGNNDDTDQTPVKACRGHYDILGVLRSDDGATIRRAYRKQALLTHPDKGGNSELFLQVTAAFEVLSNCQLRAHYDGQLDKRRCKDGDLRPQRGRRCNSSTRASGSQTCGTSAESAEVHPPPPGDEPEAEDKETWVTARLLLRSLLRCHSEEWEERLRGLSAPILLALRVHLEEMPARKQRPERNEADYPREIAPPEGLPEGWTCVENLYRSGVSKGLTYIRYTSPWGQKGFQGLPEVLKAHARWTGQEVAAPCKRSRDQEDVGRLENPQKCIYSRRTAKGVVYQCQCNWKFFRMRTRNTASLEEAIDWHIALAGARDAAQTRLSHEKGPPVPLLEAELEEILKAVPRIFLYYHTNFHKGNLKNIHTPATHDLDLAVLHHQQFWHATQDSACSKERLAELRRSAQVQVAEVQQRTALKVASLLQAVRRRVEPPPLRSRALQNRDLPALANSAHLPCETPDSGGRLPASASSGESCAALATAGAARALAPQAQASTGSPSNAVERSQALRLRHPLHVSRERRSAAAKAASLQKKPVSRERQALALRLFDVLGLSLRASKDAIKMLSGLTPANRKRRVQALVTPPRKHPPPPPPTALQRLQLESDHERPSLALEAASSGPASSSSSSTPSSSGALLALPASGASNSKNQAFQLQCAGERSGEPWTLDWMSTLLGCTLSPMMSLTLIEKSKFRSLCRGAASLGNADLFRACRSLRYDEAQLSQVGQRSRFGRERRPSCPDFVHSFPTGRSFSIETLRFLRFVESKLASEIVEELDLRNVQPVALQILHRQAVLAKMRALRSILVPLDGWSTTHERKRFVRAIPEGVAYQVVNRSGEVVQASGIEK